MSSYQAPLADMRFVLHELLGAETLVRLPGYEEATPELIDSVLTKLRWEKSGYRVFRLSLRFPVVPSTVSTSSGTAAVTSFSWRLKIFTSP